MFLNVVVFKIYSMYSWPKSTPYFWFNHKWHITIYFSINTNIFNVYLFSFSATHDTNQYHNKKIRVWSITLRMPHYDHHIRGINRQYSHQKGLLSLQEIRMCSSLLCYWSSFVFLRFLKWVFICANCWDAFTGQLSLISYLQLKCSRSHGDWSTYQRDFVDNVT